MSCGLGPHKHRVGHTQESQRILTLQTFLGEDITLWSRALPSVAMYGSPSDEEPEGEGPQAGGSAYCP